MGDQFGSRRKFVKTAGSAALLGGSIAAVGYAQDEGGQQEEAEVQTFALGGRTEGWEGLAPASIADQVNPTIQLTAGETYRVVWRNLDGEPHNFAILDENDERIPALREIMVSPTEAAPLFNATGENLTTNATFGNASELEPVNETATPATETPEAATPGPELLEVTQIISSEGAVQALQFEATEEMARYRCEVHPTTMVGDLEISTDGTATPGMGTETPTDGGS